MKIKTSLQTFMCFQEGEMSLNKDSINSVRGSAKRRASQSLVRGRVRSLTEASFCLDFLFLFHLWKKKKKITTF